MIINALQDLVKQIKISTYGPGMLRLCQALIEKSAQASPYFKHYSYDPIIN